MLRILLTGGGSGGHIYPLFAVAEELKKIAAEKRVELSLYYLGPESDYGGLLENSGIMVSAISGGKIRTYFSVLNILDGFKLICSFFQALAKLFLIMPDVIFTKGGSGTVPVVVAGAFYRIPIIVHESDAVPGRSNMAASRFASRIAASFPGSLRYFHGKNAALVGNPIRQSLLENPKDKTVAFQQLGFNPNLPLVLVLGGSQGATRINDFIFDNLDFLIKDFQFLHQVGRANYQDAVYQMQFLIGDFTPEEKSRYRIVGYFETDEEMKTAIAAADVVVARAGAGTIFEIAAFAKPSILIPLPEGRDQRANAYEFAESGAAVVIEQENLLPSLFHDQLKKISTDQELKKRMGEAAKTFSRPQAAAMIAEEILRLGRV